MERFKVCKNVYVLIGIPGSGKSTWCEDSGLKSVSRDSLRVEMGYCKPTEKIIGTSAQESTIDHLFNSRLERYCMEGIDFCIDNMNVKRRYRVRLTDVCKSFGYKITYVIFNTPFDLCVKRRSKQIQYETMVKLYDRFRNIRLDPNDYDSIIQINT